MIKTMKLSDDELKLCEQACHVVIDQCEGWYDDELIERFKELAAKLNEYTRLEYDKTPFDL